MAAAAVVSTLLLLSCASSPAGEPSRLLVKPRPGVTVEQFGELLQAYGARQVGHLGPINVYIVELRTDADARAVAATLSKNPQIEFAEVDEKVPPSRGTSSQGK